MPLKLQLPWRRVPSLGSDSERSEFGATLNESYAQEQHEAAKRSKGRKTHKGSERAPTTDRSITDANVLRRNARHLAEHEPIVAGLQLDWKTYAVPKAWIPETGSDQGNRAVRRFVKAWMRVAEIYGNHHLIDLLGIMAGSRPRDGFIGLANVTPEDDPTGMYRVQLIHAEQVGHPNPKKCAKDKAEQIYPPVEVLAEADRYLYHAGLEREKNLDGTPGALKRVHLFRNVCDRPPGDDDKGSSGDMVDRHGRVKGASTATSGEEQYEWHMAIDAEMVRWFRDSWHADDLTPATTYRPAIAPAEDSREIIEILTKKVKAGAKIAMVQKGGSYDEVNPADYPGGAPHGGGCECDAAKDQCCSKCSEGPVVTMDTDDAIAYKAPENESLDLHDARSPSAEVAGFVQGLKSAAPQAAHVPSSFAGVKGELQGTDIRVDLRKAQDEFERVRCMMERQVLVTLMEDVLAHAYAWATDENAVETLAPEVRALADVKELTALNITQGHFQWPRDLTADERYFSQKVQTEYEMGWRTDDAIITALGGDPETVERTRDEYAERLIERAKKIAKATDAEFPVVLALLRSPGPNDSAMQAAIQTGD